MYHLKQVCVVCVPHPLPLRRSILSLNFGDDSIYESAWWVVGVELVPMHLHFPVQLASPRGIGGQVLFIQVKMKKAHFCHFFRHVANPAGSQVFQI